MPQDEGITVSELDSIISEAVANFPSDSDEEQPEDSEETTEELEDESSEEVEDLDDEDLDDEEDESGDDELDEDEEEEQPEDPDALDYSPDLVVRRPDGSTVTLRELHEGILRQEDYTQKTQRVADTYRKMEQWYQERANNPTRWIAEIAYGQEDPAQAIAGAIRETGNATVLLSQTLRHLVESGEIADELVEALGLTSIAEKAKDQSVLLEVQSLKQELQRRDSSAAEQAELVQIEAQLNQQWANIVTNHGLEFANPQEGYAHKVQILEFARAHGIPNLEVAHAAMVQLSGTPAATTPQKTPKKRKQAESAVKKRKTVAMSRKPVGGAGPGKSGKSGSNFVMEAAAEALEELGLEL